MNVPLAVPDIGPDEESEVLGVLRSGRLALGPKADEFERQVAAFSGFPFVGMVWVQADRPENVERIMRDIDALFHNSEAETAAETERSFFQNFMSSFQSFIRVILGVGFLVVAAVVLIAANTSAMGVRERIPEIAMLKSLGFKRRPILVVLLCESMLQGVVGGVAGAGAAYFLFRALAAAGKTGGMGPLR